ncbi:hypothetical protein PIB30_004032 [Stylosanthes scabra]|uniref:Pentatricopeptide repeat-containing protein n=1 Tax=Stylosanthes scabra TaxID=79078 RepID=A0ABU6X111_9FABA|nr:hypothetical protein [Stylosanthes scabra]
MFLPIVDPISLTVSAASKYSIIRPSTTPSGSAAAASSSVLCCVTSFVPSSRHRPGAVHLLVSNLSDPTGVDDTLASTRFTIRFRLSLAAGAITTPLLGSSAMPFCGHPHCSVDSRLKTPPPSIQQTSALRPFPSMILFPNFSDAIIMYLRDGCSLLLKLRKPSIPLVLNTNPIFNVESNSQPQPTDAPSVEEFHVVKRLKHERDTVLALEYFKSLANSGAFKHTQSTYRIMIEKLGRNCEMDGVQYLLQQMKLEGVACSEDLFICVMNSYRRAGLGNQALKMFYRIREFGCKPTVKIYNHLLDALLSENRFQMISPVYNNMKGEGLEPNVFTYNILLKALCKNGKVDGACKMLEEMSKKGCSPDAVSYTTIVSSVCNLGQVEKAKELAKGFAPVVPVYNALINGFCKEYRIKEAFLLMNEMVVKGIDPDVISYSTVISCLSDMENIDLALAAFSQMLKRGCSPNIHTYSSLIKGYLLGGKLSEALELWNLMIMEGVKPNVVSYNALIHGLCSIGNISEAMSICNQMEKSSCSPNVTTYGTLISGFAKAGDLLGASTTWNKMINCGCRPNVVVYTSMVDALCQASMFNQAHRLIENMVTDGCLPTVVTFNTLIKGLCANGRVEGAMSVLHQMEKYECLPNIRTYNELLDGLFRVNRFREACALIKDIEERNVELNSVTYNIIMYGFSSIGIQERVLQILGKMLVNGVKPDAITVNIIIHAYSKLGKVRTAMEILDKYTVEKEMYPDIIAHTCILWGICNWLGIEEAIVYLQNKMLNKGIFPNVGTWNVLVRGFFNNLGHTGPTRILDDILGNG